MIRASCYKKTIFLLVFLTSLLFLPIAHADADGDGQEYPEDCNDMDFHTFTGAINIPYDNKSNDCDGDYDSKLYDMNDPAPPSNSVTYYRGDQIDIIGTKFYPDRLVIIAIIDPRNQTAHFSGFDPNFISEFNESHIVYLNGTRTSGFPERMINQTITLSQKHPTGVYTIYIQFKSTTSDPQKMHWIPVDTFTVVEREICDGIDNNQDGVIDEGYDLDNDGFTTCGGDCNDNNANINPNATDILCDGIDNNCNTQIDEGYISTSTTCGVGACQNTGQFICTNGYEQNTCSPLAEQPEICDGLDNDCDGFTDENNICGLPDDDNDGVNNEIDLCENTTTWFAEKKNKNHYDSANMYLTATYGCSCKQILDCKPGNNEGEYKTGCTQGTLDAWIDQDAWAKECKPKKEIQKKETISKHYKINKTNNNLEENETSKIDNKIKNEDKNTQKKSANPNNQEETKTHLEKKESDKTGQKSINQTKNELINNTQENTADKKIITKPKNQFWDVPSIMKKTITNIFRALGFGRFI